MAGNGVAGGRAIALNQVEHARRNACRIQDLGKDLGIGRAFFRRLQHHGVTSGQGRGNLQRDLVERPVPRGNHADHADRFIGDLVARTVFHEVEFLERGNCAHEPADTRADLGGDGEGQRRAHFLSHRLGEVGRALLVFLDNAFQQGQALFAGGLAIGLERAAGSGNRLVHVLGRSHRNYRTRLFRGRIDNLAALAAFAIHPLAVDIMLQQLAHPRISLNWTINFDAMSDRDEDNSSANRTSRR